MNAVCSIRPAEPADVPALIRVEVEAGQLFLDVDMPLVAADVPEPAAITEAVEAGHTWVAVVDGEVVGYVSAEIIDDAAHVGQVSIAPAHSGRRIGQRLVEHVEEWGARAGRAATTLTTFLDVPWNEPYYRRLGYEVLPHHEIGPELARTMMHEATLPGLDPSRRCAMRKPNRPDR